MRENKKYITRIVEQVLDQIAELYLYFLAVYFVCFIFSLFFERWKLFFDWEIFHFSVVLFGVLSLMSERGRKIIFSEKNLIRLRKLLQQIRSLLPRKIPKAPGFRPGMKELDDKIKKAPVLQAGIKGVYKTAKAALVLFFIFIKKILKDLTSLVLTKTKKLSRKDYLRIGIVLIKVEILIIILLYTLFYREIEPINFLVLVYALISILFVIESRIAAGIALILLASCPVLLILKKEPLAETMAIYAYYFLVICVVTQIRECVRSKLSTG